MNGYVQVYTGNGKGKTTAAIGLAVRAVGAGLNVFIGQFVKCGKYSEILALENLFEPITCRQYGSGCWLQSTPSDNDKTLAHKGLADVREVLENGAHDVVILDEANIATSYGLLSPEDLTGLIDIKPAHVELVFTGRYAAPELLARADLVTEMKDIKHYYTEQGIAARTGIES